MRKTTVLALGLAGAAVVFAWADTKSAGPSDGPSSIPIPIKPKKTPARTTAPAPEVTPRPAAAAPVTSKAQPADLILKAMKDELERSRQLSVANLDVPYYIEYALDDIQQFGVSASLGGIIGSSESRSRIPHVRVRVGDYKFDNTNYMFSDFYGGARYDPQQFSLDDNYGVFRHDLWLATDRAYKGAVEAIARKRAALKNITQNEELPDFWKAEPTEKILPIKRVSVDTAKWTSQIRDLSAIFGKYPEVLSSQVAFEAMQSTHYAHNSEGTMLRLPDSLFYLQTRAAGFAPDGSTVRDSVVMQGLELQNLPQSGEIEKQVRAVAEHVQALTKAPVGETYSGPVLFEGVAGAQMFAEVLGSNLTLPRKPIAEPGRPVPNYTSELEGRIGSRVLPEFLTVIDDPTKTDFKGTPLFGSYVADEEGVVPKPLTIVDRGRLQNFTLTRQPVKGFNASNGRARLPGGAGARTATFTNLFVIANESVKEEELKAKLIDMCKQRNKPYCMIVRKMDFPSSATIDEVRRIASAAQSSGARPVSIPLLVYKVFPDGREELVRGLRLRGFSVRTLKDIVAVSSEVHVFHLINNMAPFALMGAGSYVTGQSIMAPSVLFEDVEFERPQEDQPKLPVVPAPELSASR